MWGTSTGKSRLGSWKEWVFVLALGVLILSTAGCPPVPPGEGEGEGEGEPPTFAPGLAVIVEEVVIPEDLRPEVIFSLEDDDGNAVPMAELGDARFLLSYLVEDPVQGTKRFYSYVTRIEDPDGVANSGDEQVQATYDGARLNGVSANGDGTYTYKFATAVPADYMPDVTHQLGGQFERDYFVDDKVYVDNPVFTFVPDGSAVTETRELVETDVCNRCHTNLTLHGERHEVQLCILCHTTQSTDAQSGNTVDFPQMIHKIHRGEDLPSVEAGEPYFITGFRNTVHDYSDVAYPQDIRNCESCHTQAAKADEWKTTPALGACSACHDRTWFGSVAATPEGWENHVGGPQTNSALCAQCHPADSIASYHTLPTESAAAPGLDVAITDVTTNDVEGGVQVTVNFTVQDKNGAPYATLDSIGRFRANVAWPATDYLENQREDLLSPPEGSVLTNNGGGSYSYTFAYLFPGGTSDTFAIGFEGRVDFTYDGATVRQGVASSSVSYFTTDGSDPEARRGIVDMENCNVCHYDLHFHGGSRQGVDYCTFCHRTNESADELTINFKDMVHKIHRGEDLEMPYLGFEEIRFPGDESKCTICHEEGSYELPVPDEALPTVVMDGEDLISEVLPTSAACTDCHDDIYTFTHAALQTDFESSVESCVVCHGPGADFDVEVVHAGE